MHECSLEGTFFLNKWRFLLMLEKLIKFMLGQSIQAIDDGNNQLASECINCY
jgi:hypothetical protein